VVSVRPIHYGADLSHPEAVSASVVVASAVGLLAGPLGLALAVPYLVAVVIILCAAGLLCGYALILVTLI
jgi:hypothetical protein